MQPYDSEVGAGTFHNATPALTAPTARRTCHPQPCRVDLLRTLVARTAKLLAALLSVPGLPKPSPDSQDLILICPPLLALIQKTNDVRFVEDDWSSTLGAGVLLGVTVTHGGHSVHVLQVGGIEVDPVFC